MNPGCMDIFSSSMPGLGPPFLPFTRLLASSPKNGSVRWGEDRRAKSSAAAGRRFRGVCQTSSGCWRNHRGPGPTADREIAAFIFWAKWNKSDRIEKACKAFGIPGELNVFVVCHLRGSARAIGVGFLHALWECRGVREKTIEKH